MTARVESAEQSAQHSADVPVAHQSRILVIDDDVSMRRLIERVLASPTRAIDTAANGHDALALLREHSYEAILTDISMPGMSGLEILRIVRDVDPDVPVILVTGSPALETAIQAVEHGAFRYLLKPVEVAEIRSVVDRATRVHALARLRRRAVEVAADDVPAEPDRAELSLSLDRALASLYMVYQPIVSAREERVFGYEALVRSTATPLMSASAVLGAAEYLGRERELGRAVRRLVAKDAASAPSDAILFVNLHPAELDDETLYTASSPLASIASRVVLEVTERASLDGVADVSSRIARLRKLGFRLALDDLGAAYSGLSTLTRLEPEIVKLDMFLARGLASKSANRAVVRSMVQLCLELGMAFVCEGVETEEQRNTMLDLGCDLFQGYLYARPERGFQRVSASAFA